TVRDAGVREAADVNALAARGDRSIAVLLWNYHDDDLADEPDAIDLTIAGIPGRSAQLAHDRIDADHSNAYDAWKRMGSPQPPLPDQYRTLERDGRLQPLEAARQIDIRDGTARVSLTLPRQGVSLVRLSW